MAVIVLPEPIVDSKCKTLDWHSPHRCRIYWLDNLKILRKAVRGNIVVEIGCGVFGGLAELIIDLGCRYYVGVDFSIGNPNKKEYKVLRGEYVFSEKIPCEISIPDKVKNNSRASYIFGVDFYTFFRQLKDESVVTVSTGFFHDALLIPQGGGKGYIEKALSEIARASIKSPFAGLHQFMFDANDRSRECRSGTFFRETFEKFGIRTTPVSAKYCHEEFYTLSKQ
ncbi:MAG: hypothetical protein NT170_02875 [Candidatus Moranbacteria bacterium]|nr:hypothetical protein [Candidatus Moranbacteria bacterium]